MERDASVGAFRREGSSPPKCSNHTKRQNMAGKPEEDLAQLQEKLREAAEYVFQQRLYTHRLDNKVRLSDDAEQAAQKGELTEATRTAVQQLFDLEDTLSRRANHYIRAGNVTALSFLNERRYTHALQLLLDVESTSQKGAGKNFPYFATDGSLSPPFSNDGDASPRSPVQTEAEIVATASNLGSVVVICIPYFLKRHERTRQRVLAIIENNIGLYHFKIAEYNLAARRMGRALELEESLNVESVGVTYFNLAQVQYELGLVDEALSLISIAEETIEKQVCVHNVQRTRLGRLLGCGPAESGDNSSPLGDRSLSTYLKWREEVCLLARVLDVHGIWLSGKNNFKSAVSCFQQSERWLCSVMRLGKGEEEWLSEIRQRIQRCKRCHKRSHYDPRMQPVQNSKKQPSSVPPPNVIVTTTLPRRVEVVMAGYPNPLIEEEQQQLPKGGSAQRWKGNGRAAISTACAPQHQVCNASKISNNKHNTISSSACPVRPHKSNSSIIVRAPPDDNTPTCTPFVVRDSLPYTDPVVRFGRRGHIGSSPGGGVKNGWGAPRKLFSSQGSRLKALWVKRATNGCDETAVALKKGVAEAGRRHQGLHPGVLRRPMAKAFVPSVGWCVRVLQAFGRAKLSECVKCRKGFSCERGFGQFLGCSGYSIVSRDGNSPMNYPQRWPPDCGGNAFTSSVTRNVVDTHKCGGVSQRRPGDVLLAFLAARRSTRYVRERLLHLRYESIAREINPDHRDPCGQHSCSCRVLSPNGAQACPKHRHVEGFNYFPAPGSEVERGCTLSRPHGAVFPTGTSAGHTAQSAQVPMSAVNGGISTGMCMSPPSNPSSYWGDNVGCNSGWGSTNGGSHSIMTVRYVSGPERHTNFSGRTSETSVDRNRVGNATRCPTSRARSAETCDNSGGCHGTVSPVADEEDLVPSPRWSRNALATLTRHVRSEKEPRPSSSLRAMKLLTAFDCKSRKFPAHATASLMRHRVLREEAALIVQAAWREWKTRRQEEALRGLANRKIDE